MSVWNDWSRSERRGNYAMMTGVLMTAIIGFSAFSVDISLITLAELQAQATADAASHAALVAFRINNDTGEGDTAAQWMVNYNKVATAYATIDPGYPQYGTWDYTTATFTPGLGAGGFANAAEVAVSREGANTLELMLAPILGVYTHDVHADSITAQQDRAIMMVIDQSCSMQASGNTSAVALNRIGAMTFLDYFVDHPQDGDLLGMSVFAKFALLEPTLANPNGTQGPSTTAPTVNQRPWMPLVEVETNTALLRTRFAGICRTNRTSDFIGGLQTLSGTQCRVDLVSGLASGAGTWVYKHRSNEISSNTNPYPALYQAVNELYYRSDAPDNRYFKGIVFMTDGVANVPDQATAESNAISVANDAWAHDISIWTILYHNGSFNDTFMRNMVRGSGYFASSPDAADLPVLYEQVAKSIPTALVR
ncbi:MAG: hypothetical protein H6735_13840 [Alphaproteobacteria bacterium]|nr:hypothetical protein [Alphaproteobacteria bacterium]